MKLTTFFALLVMLLSSEFVSAQLQVRIDSLRNEISTNLAQDSTRVENLIRLSALVGRSNPLQSRAYGREAAMLSRKLGLMEKEAKALGNLGISYAIQAETDSALATLEEALVLFKTMNDLQSMARMNSSIATLYAMQNKYEEGISSLLATIPIFEELNDSLNLALAYFNIGQMYSDQLLFEQALERTLRAAGMYEEMGLDRKIPVTYAAIAQSLIALGREEEALDYVERGLAVVEPNVDVPSERNLHNMAGRLYEKSGKLDEASRSYRIALDKANQLRSNRLAIGIKLDLAGVDYKRSDYASSKRLLEDILITIDENKIKGMARITKSALDLLSRSEARLGNSTRALTHLRQAKALSDSIYKEESALAIAELETIYETEKKEAQIQLLEAQNEVANLRTVIIGVVALVLLVGAFLGFRRYHLKKSEEKRARIASMKQELQQYGLVLSEKNKFIATFKNDLEEVRRHVRTIEGRKELTQLVDVIHQNTNLTDDEELLFSKIEKMNMGFFHALRKLSNELTAKDERLAMLVQMDLTNKDIANILHIEADSVKQARRRLKRKLQLDAHIDLQDYLKRMAA
ncbi:MAG: hypothetical protein AAFW89_01100 [Bacteroidota bacterium]